MRLLAAALTALLALPGPRASPAQDATAPQPAPPASSAAPAAAPPAPPALEPAAADQPAQDPSPAPAGAGLAPGDVARIDDTITLTDADLDRYLATVYARLPEGDAVLKQLVDEALIEHDAAALGLTASDADVATAQASLDEQARAATGGAQGLAQSLGDNVSPEALQHALRLLVVHERIVRSTLGLPPDAPVEPRQLQEWLDGRLSTAQLQPAELDDPQAATLDIGAISKAQVGARLRTVLKPETVSGVLTEMIGVLLVRRRAAAMDIDLTPAAATQEILDRDAALRARAGVGDVTYKQYVESVQKRSLEELLQSDKFSTEVLIRLIVSKDWSEERARAYWEKNRAAYAKTLGDGGWDDVRSGVWRDLRQRAYRRLFEESTIVRRF